MSLADLNAKITQSENSRVNEEPPKDSKKVGQSSRAHAHDRDSAGVVKMPKALKSLLSAINDDDLEQVAQVYRDAMTAETRFWIDEGKDPETGRAKGYWKTMPDHKTRIAAANMVAAYREGLPVARQVNLNIGHEELKDVLARAKESPATLDALRMLGAGHLINSAQNTAQSSERNVTPPASTE